uniref:DUF5641 domain-containing protein n=1 Tax=Onchocerca volvulus TaxID=6282 RepID=A0A8R1TMJ0_ONCVO
MTKKDYAIAQRILIRQAQSQNLTIEEKKKWNDYQVIRPIDFISPTFTFKIPIKNNEEDEEYTPYPLRTKDKVVECWKQVLKTLDVFWNRWRDEYLSSLRERTQREIVSPRSVETREPQENGVVLLAESEKPRATWKLAKIINLKRGRDGCIRSAKIQLSNGSTQPELYFENNLYEVSYGAVGVLLLDNGVYTIEKESATIPKFLIFFFVFLVYPRTHKTHFSVFSDIIAELV